METALATRQQPSNPLHILSESILEAFKNDTLPSEEMLRGLSRIITEYVIDEDCPLPPIEELLTHVETYYNYSDLSKSDERVFDLGACWACLNVYLDADEIHAERQKESSLRMLLQKHRPLFRIVEENPGIGHAELANALGGKIARLSQIMSELKATDLISSVKLGRHKNYYLTSKSKHLLHEKPQRSVSSLCFEVNQSYTQLQISESENGRETNTVINTLSETRRMTTAELDSSNSNTYISATWRKLEEWEMVNGLKFSQVSLSNVRRYQPVEK